MGREGYDSTYSGSQHRYEESNGTNDDEVYVMGEESGQSGEDAEGDDIWCDVCDLSALDVHQGEDMEDGDIEDEIPRIKWKMTPVRESGLGRGQGKRETCSMTTTAPPMAS